MADVIFENYALQSSSHPFSGVWKWTRAMKKAGWTYKASGDGSAKDTTGTASNDKWGGNADPAVDAYPAGLDSVAAWWCAQGPTVVKVSMTAAPTGNFIRSEKVTQATSGAEGELVGYDFDGVNVGHAVIIPRTGTFDNTHVITGAASGATFTATGIETYVSEIVISKAANTTQGSVYMQRGSNENENASRFSVLAASAGCTATVAPGGTGTGNAFPTLGTYVGHGTQNGSVVHANWWPNTTNLGKAQICAVNVVGATGVTPDGTTWIVQGDTTGSSTTLTQMMGYLRCDDSEDGDLDPFVFCKPSGTGYNNAAVRVTATVGTSLGTGPGVLLTANTPGSLTWRGWRRRGWASADAFAPLTTAQLNFCNSANSVMGDNQANPETFACSYTTKRFREKIWIIAADNTLKIRKGSLRWMWQMQGNTSYDTFDSKLKMIFIPQAANFGSILLGPFDGSTVPTQT